MAKNEDGQPVESSETIVLPPDIVALGPAKPGDKDIPLEPPDPNAVEDTAEVSGGAAMDVNIPRED